MYDEMIQRRTVATLAAGLLFVGVLAGCTPGPAYVRPSVAVPEHYREDGVGRTPAAQSLAGWQRATPQDTVNRGDWWTVFGDEQLNQLESRVTVSNQTIRKAVAELEQARATAGVARAAYSPTVTAGIAADRDHTSQNVVGRSLAGKTVSDYSAVVDVSWEPDLFDRIGHQVDAANARAQASDADLSSVTLSMHADLALDYIDLRQLDVEADVLKQTTAAYKQAVELVQHRVDGGIASASDLAEAETQFETSQAQLIDLGVARAQREHAIETLIGVPASSFSLPTRSDSLPLPNIPAGLPSGLLERRPDIAAAERRVAAANADVGEATSAFFPDLLLSATGGLEASNLANWASLPSRLWAIGPSLVGTLFDGGKRKQELTGARARQDAATADYRLTVLTAFQDVEDNLASLQVLGKECDVQQRAVDASDQSLRLALNRYQAGAADYLEVVSAQSANLTNVSGMVDLSRRRLVADVLLVKALGGIWESKT